MNRLIALIVLLSAMTVAAAPKVAAVRCPNDGLQPEAAVDSEGTVHLIYLKGQDSAAVDVFYVTSRDGGQTWAEPVRVNSQAGAAIATGTVRGAQLALGRGGRPHVAWMGSQSAEPKGPGGATPMLYARMNETGDRFEAQRNLITAAPGLDGGGSIAADAKGTVYVGWHAPTPGMKGEENRTVWLAVSRDDGRTFGRESQMLSDPTGVCGCCGMKLAVDPTGELRGLYRAANSETRDIYLLASGGRKEWFKSVKVETLAIKTCPMSTAAFASGGERTLAAWEGGGQVSFGPVDRMGEAVAAPGKGIGRKHPALAVNKEGQVVLAWSEGTGWKKGGSVAWQVFDGALKPVADARGTQAGLAVWSKPAAVAVGDGAFLIIY